MQEAEIISETQNATEPSIHEALSLATENKPPSAALTQNSWYASEEPETPLPGAETPPPQKETIAPEQGEDGKVKVPDKIKKQSAETATMMWDQLLTAFCTWRARKKYEKKFSVDEMNLVVDKNMEDAPETNFIEEKEIITYKKFHRLTKKLQRTMSKIPLTEDETRRHEDAFYHVFKIKDISMPPEWILYANLGFTLIDRLTEVEFD